MAHMKAIRKFRLIFACMILLSGCNTNANLPTPSQTGLATSIITQTQAPITESPIASPTLILAPTLSSVEVKAKVFDLLTNNGDCRLPCFWGFLPNRDAGEFITFLNGMRSPDGALEFKHNDLYTSINIEITEDAFGIYTDTYRTFGSGLGVKYIYGDENYAENFSYYSLPNLLTNYGAPDESYVVLDTGIADMGLGIDLYLLSIEYTNSGWMAVFKMPLHQEDSIFYGCPSEAFVNLRTWLPEVKPSDAFYGGFGGNDKSYLFTIEEATGLSIEEFYQKFKDPENTSCLETPADIHK